MAKIKLKKGNSVVTVEENLAAELTQVHGYEIIEQLPGATDLDDVVSKLDALDIDGINTQLAQTVQLVNVKAFGAVGDGVADDTQAIKNAIKAVAQHGKVYFPYGCYRITDTIANINSTGGYFAFDWEGEAAGSFIYVDINDVTKNAIEVIKVNMVSMRNLTFIGKQDCCKNVIYTDMFMRSKLQNITVLAGCAEYAFYTISGYCNMINLITPNNFTTGTDMSTAPLMSGKWAFANKGIYMTDAFASEYDVVLEGLRGDAIHADDSKSYNQSITIKGTIENNQGRGLHIKNTTVLVIDNLYEEANYQSSPYIGSPRSIFEDCHFVEITGHRAHYGAYKFKDCSNINSGNSQMMQDVTGNNGYSNTSPYTFNASIEIESNATTGIAPVRNKKSKPKFLAYPFLDRVSASSRLADTFTYGASTIITAHTESTDTISGTPIARIIPQTNYNHLRLNIADKVSGLNGRMIYATIIIRKPVTTLVDPYYEIGFVSQAGNAPAKNVYLADLEDGWNRITIATKISADSLDLPSYLRVRGFPASGGDSNLFLPIEVCYVAITVDNPSVSPFDFDGTVHNETVFKNGKKETIGTAAPTGTNIYTVVGDKVVNSTPSAGGYLGWVCTTAGSPGTWKGFGLIEA